MANQYAELKKKHQQEFSEFPMGFAFNKEQLEEGLESLGLTATQTYLVTSIGAGGFIRKSDAQDYAEMILRHNREIKEAMDDDPIGDGFIYDMFLYELANHEYGYTREIEDTLEALGIEEWEVNASERLQHGLEKACRVLEEADE